MQIELYQAETAHVAAEQAAILAEAREILLQRKLSLLEQSGVLHALQVLIENAIGKAKQLLKTKNEPVPVSAYDAFSALVRCKVLNEECLSVWYSAIGLRNRIVHDYMNIDMNQVLELITSNKEQFITEFLLMPFKVDS
jgi:uncharacterized protein YutE (UPF0331/DUF86 family)